MMGCLSFYSFPDCSSASFATTCKSTAIIIRPSALEFQADFSVIHPQRRHFGLLSTRRRQVRSNSESLDNEEESLEEALVQDLRVPDNWLLPSKAVQESEWLRASLQKWLDDEYCPEATNVEISKVASHSFYESLIHKQTDLGEILLKMARDLESISYQESFHGAFSSANAAVNLIVMRIEQE